MRSSSATAAISARDRGAAAAHARLARTAQSVAAWASVVGCAYGACAVATGNVAVAMAAHAMANYASAALWLKENPDAAKA